MTELPDHSQAESTLRHQTETARPSSGTGSGNSPTVKTAVGTEGHGRSRSPKIERVFGIDFGEESTRVAVLKGGRAFFTTPGIFKSEVSVVTENLQNNMNTQVVQGLRSKLLKPEYLFPQAEKNVKSFFKEIYKCINNAANSEHPKAVLTVPAYYSSHQRIRLKLCAESSGLQIIGLLNDYAAVVHSFVAGRLNRSGTILVLSIGADAVSTAIVKVHDALIETVCSQSRPNIGGAQIVDALADALLQKFENGTKVLDLTFEQILVWRARARNLLFKHAAGHDEITFGDFKNRCTLRIPGAELNDILSVGFESTIDLVEQVIDDSGISRLKIDFVVIAGGIVSNPVVANYLARSFPQLHRMILNADMTPAFGAALRAGVLEQQRADPLIWDLLTQPVYKMSGASKQVIIPSGISIPAAVQTTMTSADSHIGQQESGDEVSVVPTANIGASHVGQPVSIEVKVTADGTIEVVALADLVG